MQINKLDDNAIEIVIGKDSIFCFLTESGSLLIYAPCVSNEMKKRIKEIIEEVGFDEKLIKELMAKAINHKNQ